MMIDYLKSIVKKSIFLIIFFDYILTRLGLNFESEYKISKYINELDTIIDIGVNKGESIKNFKRYVPTSNIIAFEALKSNYTYVSKKLKKINNLKIYNFAITNKMGFVNFYTPILLNFYRCTGQSSIYKKELDQRLKDFFKIKLSNVTYDVEKVEMRPLDSFNLKPDLIKIDTEGSELDVIKSSINTIKSYKPVILIEYNSSNYDEIKKFLSKNNYYSCYLNKNEINLTNEIIENIFKNKTNLQNIIFLEKIKHKYLLNKKI